MGKISGGVAAGTSHGTTAPTVVFLSTSALDAPFTRSYWVLRGCAGKRARDHCAEWKYLMTHDCVSKAKNEAEKSSQS
jgi:hypothetical protein